MDISDSNTMAEGTVHSMDLVVEQAGSLGITVKAGPVVFHGEASALGSDDLFTVTNRDTDTDVVAYLTKDTANSDAITVLVDEVVLDGVDQRYAYQRGDRYALVAQLYAISVPANTSDLVDVPLTRYTIKETV